MTCRLSLFCMLLALFVVDSGASQDSSGGYQGDASDMLQSKAMVENSLKVDISSDEASASDDQEDLASDEDGEYPEEDELLEEHKVSGEEEVSEDDKAYEQDEDPGDPEDLQEVDPEENEVPDAGISLLEDDGYKSCNACKEDMRKKSRQKAKAVCEKKFPAGPKLLQCLKDLLKENKPHLQILCADSCLSLQQTELDEEQELKEETMDPGSPESPNEEAVKKADEEVMTKIEEEDEKFIAAIQSQF